MRKERTDSKESDHCYRSTCLFLLLMTLTPGAVACIRHIPIVLWEEDPAFRVYFMDKETGARGHWAGSRVSSQFPQPRPSAHGHTWS